jgi:hypothetical protein
MINRTTTLLLTAIVCVVSFASAAHAAAGRLVEGLNRFTPEGA